MRDGDSADDPENRAVMDELPLLGGDVTAGIVLVADTVRRPMGPHSGLVHGVLGHLQSVGFAGAPRLLGVDEQNREILTYIPGEVAGRPWPPWVADPERAISVAALLRELDDAMVSWGLPPDSFAGVPSPSGIPPRVGPRPHFVGHRDLTPENVVFRAGRAVALIDFDLAQPSSRVDEFCNLALWWAPLMPPADRPEVVAELDCADRLRLLADAYGLNQQDRGQVVSVAINHGQRSWFLMKERAAVHGGGWQRMWDDGVGDLINRRVAWMERAAAELHDAVTS